MGEREDRAKRLGGIVGVVQSVAPGGSYVMLTLPTVSGDAIKHNVRLDFRMLHPRQGVVGLPEPGDEVLVAFEHGDMRRPVVIGYLWDDKDKPPQSTGGKTRRTLQRR